MTTPTLEQFQQLLATHPGLCALGYCNGYCERYEANRQDLAHSYADFCRAYAWLCDVPRIKQKRYTSYGWKHTYEHVTGHYVTNGVFIAAALASCVPCEIPQPPARGLRLNVPLGLSLRYMRQCERKPTA
jgi:hypothetical protein